MLKAVVDANIWTSALINQGPPYKVINAFRRDVFQVFYPSQLLGELSDVLYREKLRPRINLRDIPELPELIETKATVVAIDSLLSASRDPKDNAYLACAEAAHSLKSVADGYERMMSGKARFRVVIDVAGE